MSERREQISEEISDALDGRLSESEERAFRARLDADPEFARVWEAQRRIRETLLGIGTESAPAELAGRLALELRRPDQQTVTPFAPRRSLRLALLRAAAAVVLLVGAVATWSILFREDSSTTPPTTIAEGSDAGPLVEGDAPPAPSGAAFPEVENEVSEDAAAPSAPAGRRRGVPGKVAESPLTTHDPAHAVYRREMRETLKAQAVSRIRASKREDLRLSGDADDDVAEIAGALLVEAESIPEELHDEVVEDASRLFDDRQALGAAMLDEVAQRQAKESETPNRDLPGEPAREGARKAPEAKKAADPRSAGDGRRARAKGAGQPDPAPAPTGRPRTAIPDRPRARAGSAAPSAGFYLVSNGNSGAVVSRSIASLPANAVRELHLGDSGRPHAKDSEARAQRPEAVSKPDAPRYRIYQLTLPHAQADRLVSDLETQLGSKLRAVGQGSLPRSAPENTGAGTEDATLRVLRLVVTTSD